MKIRCILIAILLVVISSAAFALELDHERHGREVFRFIHMYYGNNYR